MRKPILLAFLALAIPSRAADLPPLDEVKHALTNAPPVKESEAGIDFERSNDSMLKSGAYEYEVQMTGAQRRDYSLGQTLNEWSMQLSRPVRFPGKTRLDEDLGTQGIRTAQLAHGDALHESAKKLLGLWFAWVREKIQENEWQNQSKLLRKEAIVVEKRVRAGDAPRLELNLAKAASDQAAFSALQAKMREDVAEKTLAANFPGISLPENPVLEDPKPLEQSFDYWKEKILSQNHAILLARSEARKAQIMASRVRADRMPDPTIGIRYSSEYGGSQRVMGGVLSIPLPGDYRKAAAEGAAASAEMATQRELDATRRVNAEVSSNYTMARASYNGWEKSREAAQGMTRNAELISRAYALGEAGLGEVLASRRLAIESRLASKLAQSEAIETRYRLMVDAHLLWDFDENTRQQ